MERKDYETYANGCHKGKKPACSCACPLNIDIPAIMDYMQKGNFTGAYKQYRNQSMFPGIVSRICDERCGRKCVRWEKDCGVSIKLLEQACVRLTDNDKPARYNLPKRPKKIAVIGGGLAGLACALKLGTKSYDVTLYEKEAQLGGRLKDMLPPEIYLAEIEKQMQFARCKIVLEREIKSLDEIEFDAAFIATGAGGNDFGLSEGMDRQSFGTVREGVFIGGAVLGASPVEDLAQGDVASRSIEKYTKIGKMDGIPESFLVTETCIQKDLSLVEPQDAVVPADGRAYTREEAAAESQRCLKCDCTFCSDGCEVFDYFQKSPQLMVVSALTSLQSAAGLSKQTTTQLISACNLCGLCGKVCPENIDIGQMSYDFRFFRSQSNRYPPAYNEFFIRDMNFSNSEAALARTAPGHARASYLFFPGCQLGASDPEYVVRSYQYLLEHIPDTAIMLGCCGAPADWGANRDLNAEVVGYIKAKWEEFGRPVFVFACPTCKKQFGRHFPEAEGVSLYELIAKYGVPEGARKLDGQTVHVFDPCASREEPDMQQAVRDLTHASGARTEELRYSRDKAQCCGWGGHTMKANPSLHGQMVQHRIEAGPHPYITYCTNCRDTFNWRGKECVHILDVVFGMNQYHFTPPSPGTRRKNRVAAKNLVLEQVFAEVPAERKEDEFLKKVEFSPEITKKLNDLLILEEEAARTIEHCESTGKKLYDPENDSYIGHLQIGIITYWVEYRVRDDRYILLNVYSHRMSILEEDKKQGMAGETASDMGGKGL